MSDLEKVRDCVIGALSEPPDPRAVPILRAWCAENVTIDQAFYASCLRRYPAPKRYGPPH